MTGLGASNRYHRSGAVVHSPMYSVEWVSGELASAAFGMVWGSLQKIPDDGPWTAFDESWPSLM